MDLSKIGSYVYQQSLVHHLHFTHMWCRSMSRGGRDSEERKQCTNHALWYVFVQLLGEREEGMEEGRGTEREEGRHNKRKQIVKKKWCNCGICLSEQPAPLNK